LSNQEWKGFINIRSSGDYQVARHGWTGDYADPMTFIDMFTPASGNDNAQYNNPAHNDLVRIANPVTDQALRMQAMHAAENILMDDACHCPDLFLYQCCVGKTKCKRLCSLGIRSYLF
jgi:oligopeptide transport system substrate-binding protein